MSTLGYIVLFSLIGGIVSLIGGLLLLASKKRARLLSEYATPFAAGALLAAAFIDLLPEATSEGNPLNVHLYTLAGILLFFILERFLHWFHHHHEHASKATDPRALLVVVGDTVHNIIDGVAIAAGFMVDTTIGVIVTLAVAAHEIPQEIGDFGLLLNKGIARGKVILINIASALATTIAAVAVYLLSQSSGINMELFLGITAGFFIYIAVSDIIPSIHAKEARSFAGLHTLALIAGVIVVATLTLTLHSVADV